MKANVQKRRSLEGGGEVVEKGEGMGSKRLLFMIYLKKAGFLNFVQ